MPPKKKYIPLEMMVKEQLPNFAYQLQLAGHDVEEKIKTKEQIKEFLNALYGGRGPNGEIGFNVTDGVLFQNLPTLEPTPLLSAKVDPLILLLAGGYVMLLLNRSQELNYYTDELPQGLAFCYREVSVTRLKPIRLSDLKAALNETP